MKTAKVYFKEIFIIILFGFFLMWLVSCGNSNDATIKQIHAYRDSIGINNIKQRLLLMQIDSLKKAHGSSFPPGIGTMLMAKIRLEANGVDFENKIDSLKIELYK